MGKTMEEGGAVLVQDDEKEEAIDPEEDRAMLEKKALKAMGAMEEGGDAVFGSNDEVNLDSQVYWWHDKYRPTKPNYLNRVHTGPYPKTVQGYKFNIFYPVLVDKSKAPTYVIEKDGDSFDTCNIRFRAGAPYEDIAFRIVNREWEYSHKKGFKCIFDGGILHLYLTSKIPLMKHQASKATSIFCLLALNKCFLCDVV